MLSSARIENFQELAIVGAHLRGFPLNYQLLNVDAKFGRSAKTARAYRLYELPSSNQLRKPGLKRVLSTEEGASIHVEVWKLSDEALGRLMGFVPPPLAIGSVELEDGSWIKGFVCEAWGFEGARDITSFGGWKNYITSLTPVLTKDENDLSSSAPSPSIQSTRSK